MALEESPQMETEFLARIPVHRGEILSRHAIDHIFPDGYVFEEVTVPHWKTVIPSEFGIDEYSLRVKPNRGANESIGVFNQESESKTTTQTVNSKSSIRNLKKKTRNRKTRTTGVLAQTVTSNSNFQYYTHELIPLLEGMLANPSISFHFRNKGSDANASGLQVIWFLLHTDPHSAVYKGPEVYTNMEHTNNSGIKSRFGIEHRSWPSTEQPLSPGDSRYDDLIRLHNPATSRAHFEHLILRIVSRVLSNALPNSEMYSAALKLNDILTEGIKSLGGNHTGGTVFLGGVEKGSPLHRLTQSGVQRRKNSDEFFGKSKRRNQTSLNLGLPLNSKNRANQWGHTGDGWKDVGDMNTISRYSQKDTPCSVSSMHQTGHTDEAHPRRKLATNFHGGNRLEEKNSHYRSNSTLLDSPYISVGASLRKNTRRPGRSAGLPLNHSDVNSGSRFGVTRNHIDESIFIEPSMTADNSPVSKITTLEEQVAILSRKIQRLSSSKTANVDINLNRSHRSNLPSAIHLGSDSLYESSFHGHSLIEGSLDSGRDHPTGTCLLRPLTDRERSNLEANMNRLSAEDHKDLYDRYLKSCPNVVTDTEGDLLEFDLGMLSLKDQRDLKRFVTGRVSRAAKDQKSKEDAALQMERIRAEVLKADEERVQSIIHKELQKQIRMQLGSIGSVAMGKNETGGALYAVEGDSESDKLLDFDSEKEDHLLEKHIDINGFHDFEYIDSYGGNDACGTNSALSTTADDIFAKAMRRNFA